MGWIAYTTHANARVDLSIDMDFVYPTPFRRQHFSSANHALSHFCSLLRLNWAISSFILAEPICLAFRSDVAVNNGNEETLSLSQL